MTTKSGAGGLVYSVVAIAIIVLIVSTVAVPVVEDAQKELIVEKQMSGQLYSAVGATETVTLGCIANQHTFNGSIMAILFPDLTETTRFYVISDSLFAMTQYEVGVGWDIWGYKSTIQPSIAGLSVGQSIVFDNGVATITAEESRTVNYTFLMVPDQAGNYGVWNYDHKPWYVDSDSVIYAALSSEPLSYVLSGTLTAMDADMIINNDSIVSGTVSVSSVKTDDKQSNLLSAIYLTESGSTNELPWYAVIFAPLTYHTLSDNGEMINNLIAIIPVLLFLVPVMFAVRMIQTRRN